VWDFEVEHDPDAVASKVAAALEARRRSPVRTATLESSPDELGLADDHSSIRVAAGSRSREFRPEGSKFLT
jgi:hypothetical protein